MKEALESDTFGLSSLIPESAALPTRLVDLGPPDQHESHASLKFGHSLRSTEQDPIKYAALSYCWGLSADAEMQFKATQENLSRLQAGFAIADTTAVIQDVVRVCRTLGFRFLWVDAICIIQNDASDWHREASRMRNVYANASAIICASAFESCVQPFLVNRPPTISVPFFSSVNTSIRGSLHLRFVGATS